MKEVTDPTLLEELDKKVVVDPAILSQLEGEPEELSSHTPVPFAGPRREHQPILDYLKETVSNIPGSLDKMLTGGIQLLKDPLGSGREMAGLISGGERSILRGLGVPLGPERIEEQQFKETTAPLVEGIIHPERIPGMVFEKIKEDPAVAASAILPYVPKMFKTTTDIDSALALASKNLKVKNAVRDGVAKALKPTASEMGTSPQATEMFFNKAEIGVRHIVENKENLKYTTKEGDVVSGRIPDSVDTALSAVMQQKPMVYEKYHSIAKQLGQEGAEVDLLPVAADIRKMASDSWLNTHKPELVKYLGGLAKEYEQLGKIGFEEAEKWVQKENKILENFSKNPDYQGTTRIELDYARTASLRREMDRAAESLGPEYKEFKNIYGGLRTLEDPLLRKRNAIMKQETKGLLNLSGTWSSAEIATGLLTGSGGRLGLGSFVKGISWAKDKLTSPDHRISNMFKEVDKNVSPKRISPIPEISEEELSRRLMEKSNQYKKNERPEMFVG